MVTFDDVEFEPPMPKVWHIGNIAIALVAGSSAAQAEIVKSTIGRNPLNIHQVIHHYCLELAAHNRRNAERTILGQIWIDYGDVPKNSARDGS
jgi:hypothetical protein